MYVHDVWIFVCIGTFQLLQFILGKIVKKIKYIELNKAAHTNNFVLLNRNIYTRVHIFYANTILSF